MGTLREPPFSTSFYAPLIISMLGIISSALALIIYHLILTKYCLVRRNSTTPQTINTSSTTLLRPTTIQEAHHLPIGVDKKILENIPIISYNSIHKKGKSLFRVDQNECAVCLGELEDQELVRLLPNCRHTFHVACIDKWFVAHASCPVCRAPITETETHIMYLLELLSRINLNEENPPSYSSSSSLEVQPRGMLRHCVSYVVPKERRSTILSQERGLLITGLRRSLSMDHNYYNHEGDSSLRSKSAKLLRSLSRLGRGKGNQIIPY